MTLDRPEGDRRAAAVVPSEAAGANDRPVPSPADVSPAIIIGGRREAAAPAGPPTEGRVVTFTAGRAVMLGDPITDWRCTCGGRGWEVTEQMADTAWRRHRGAAQGWQIRRARALVALRGEDG